MKNSFSQSNRYSQEVDIETIKVGGSKYHSDAEEVNGHFYRVKGKKHVQKCLVYFHGGHGFAGSSVNYKEVIARYACECGVTILAVDYRLEHKKLRNPKYGMVDGFAALWWLMDPSNA